MNIVFFCQNCGARFEVPPTSGGKQGRCKKCGQMMAIPRPQELASMVALPAIAPGKAAARPARAVAAGPAGRGDSLAWLAAVGSNVGLAPLTGEGLPVVRARKPGKPRYDDDLGDSKPYQIGEPLVKPARHSSGHVAGALTMLWRRDLGVVQRAFRWLNEAAYLVSVPFLMLILLGAILRSRPMALAGATAVVLLNLGRIVAGVANLVVVPFREGVVPGVLFLIPPITFIYLSNHWNRLKKPTLRVVGPVATIGLVFAAFTFIPSLRRDGRAVGVKDLGRDLEKQAESLEREMIGEVKEARKVDVNGLEKRAAKAVGDAAKAINSIGQPGEAGQSP